MQNIKKWQIAAAGILAIIFLILILTNIIPFGKEADKTGLYISNSSGSTRQLSNDRINEITKYVDACIPDQFKGRNFRIDITNSNETSKPMVSFQLHDETSSQFEDESNCMEAVKQVYGKLLEHESYPTIQSFQFAFIPVSGNISYFIDIDDTSKVPSISELDNHAVVQQS